MIEPNKYTDETIHVANWLMATGEGIELLELARQDAEKRIATLDPKEHDFNKMVVSRLRERINFRFMEAYCECFPNNWAGGVDEIECVHPIFENYESDDLDNEDLIRPFVGAAVARLDLSAVANLIFAEYTISIPA